VNDAEADGRPEAKEPTETGDTAASTADSSGTDLVVVANRLPVDRRTLPDGSTTWQPSPGGLVAALEPVMQGNAGAWIGWTGSAGDTPEPFEANGIRLVPVSLDESDVENFYEGMSNRRFTRRRRPPVPVEARLDDHVVVERPQGAFDIPS